MNIKTKKTTKTARPPVAIPPGCDALLSKAQVCFLLGVSSRTLSTLRATGAFPAPDTQVGKLNRWWSKTVNDWIASRCRKEST